MFASPWQLNKRGILGMNRRNISYISRYNERRLFPLVDNKIKTKVLAEAANISTPKLIGLVENQYDVNHLADILKGINGFAIKPAKGSGGKGILVLRRNAEGEFVKNSGTQVSISDLQRHVTNILAGLHSLGGNTDVALIEELIEFDDYLAGFSFEGVPDIRVIICRGYPVMSMIRLATRASDGKANLHQGAVGVGLDIATGRPLRAVQFGERVTHHPDTGRDLSELVIPEWPTLLTLAASCYEISRLGYLGTDMVLDRNHGPMLLELNARPGLAIQLANGEGLLHRLRKIDSLKKHELSLPAKERAALSQQWFASKKENLL